MATNPTRLLIGATPVDLLDIDDPTEFTTVHARTPRLFAPDLGAERAPLGEIHLGVGAPGEFGSGPLVDLSSGDPVFFEQLAEAAAQAARSLRELAAENGDA